MKVSTARRYALCFILLALGQEFSLARYAPQTSLSEIDRTIKGQDLTSEFELKRVEDEEKQLQLFDQDRQSSEEYEEEEEDKGETALEPQKRINIGLVVLAVQIGFSAANLGLEIFYKIKGCCGFHPKACNYRDEFEATQKRITPLSKEIDKMASDSVKLKEDIIQSNYQLNALWNEMKTINAYEEEIVKILLPSVTKLFQDKYDEIKVQLENKNSTVQKYTYDQVTLQFQSVFDNYETTLLAMSTWVGYGLMAGGMVAFNSYRTSKINQLVSDLSTGEGYKQLVMARHTKAAKTLGVDKVGLNKFILDTATNKVNSKFGGVKMARILTGINIAAGLITAGFDVYAIVLKVKQCEDIQSRAYDGKEAILKAETDLKEVKQNVSAYADFLHNVGWTFITNQTTNATLHKALEDIRELVANADHKTTALENAITSINAFLKDINNSTADTNTTFLLLKNLATGLHSITFKMKCYENKIRLINHVSELCKNGTNDLYTLYTRGLSSFGVAGDSCIIDSNGTPYTSFDKFKSSIHKMAAAQNYSSDCMLNDPVKQTQVCTYKAQGYSNITAAVYVRMNLSPDQVQYFMDKCPAQELTPKDKENICMFKQMGWTAAKILPILSNGVELATVQDYLDNGACPPTD